MKNAHYKLVGKDWEIIPPEYRTEFHHRELIKHYGSVQQYLISLGVFKEVKKIRNTANIMSEYKAMIDRTLKHLHRDTKTK